MSVAYFAFLSAPGCEYQEVWCVSCEIRSEMRNGGDVHTYDRLYLNSMN